MSGYHCRLASVGTGCHGDLWQPADDVLTRGNIKY